MRETYDYNKDLLAALAEQDMDAAPLTGAEFDRVLALAQCALPAAAGRPQKQTHKSKGWKTMRKVLVAAAAAACVFLGGMNIASPAFAEDLPVVGGLFAWLNGHTNSTLASEQLDDYAAEVDLAAVAADGAEETLTLRQIWRDEEMMRLSVELTDADGSLAGYNAIAFYDGAFSDPHAGHGDLAFTANGLENFLHNQGGSGHFIRVDDATFAAELRYRFDPGFFAEYEKLVGTPMRLTFNDLRGCVLEKPVRTESGAICTASSAETPLPGSYTVTFDFPAVSTGGRRTAACTEVQNMLSVPELVATPAYTRIEVLAQHDSPFGGGHNSQQTGDTGELPCFVLTGSNGEVYCLERWEGGLVVDGDPASDTHYISYFDAIPEDVDTVTLGVYHSDERGGPLGEPEAEFTLKLK